MQFNINMIANKGRHATFTTIYLWKACYITFAPNISVVRLFSLLTYSVWVQQDVVTNMEKCINNYSSKSRLTE